MKKAKLTFVALAAALLFGSIPVPVSAAVTESQTASGYCGADDAHERDVTWMLDADGVLTVSGTGDMKNYSEPGSSEAASAPWNADEVTAVVIESGITGIGDSAFYNCQSLTTVSIPDSVTDIGEGAFLNCDSVEYLTIPAGVKRFGSRVFNASRFLCLTFLGDAPAFQTDTFACDSGCGYAKYPADNATWTEEVRQSCGSIEWVTDDVTFLEPIIINPTASGEEQSETHTITYHLGKGTNNAANPDTYSGEAVKLKNPSRAGYLFKGWYTDSAYENRITSIKAGADSDYTLYAKWKKITLKKTVVTSGKNSKSRQILLKYKKVSGAKGYEISYSTDKKFAKAVKKATSAKTSVTLKKLTKGKTYYLRVRAYRKDSAGKKVYGKYSKVLSVKVAK